MREESMDTSNQKVQRHNVRESSNAPRSTAAAPHKAVRIEDLKIDESADTGGDPYNSAPVLAREQDNRLR